MAYVVFAVLYILGQFMTSLLVWIWVRDNRPEAAGTKRERIVAIVAMLIWPLIPFILLAMVLWDWNKEDNHEPNP